METQPLERTPDGAPKVITYWSQVFDGGTSLAALGFALLFVLLGFLTGNEGGQLLFPGAGLMLLLFFLIPWTSKEKRQLRKASQLRFNTWYNNQQMLNAQKKTQSDGPTH